MDMWAITDFYHQSLADKAFVTQPSHIGPRLVARHVDNSAMD
jgi:hypothetical protein